MQGSLATVRERAKREDDRNSSSRSRDTDEKFSYTFAKAGTDPYYCFVRPEMTGTIVVQ